MIETDAGICHTYFDIAGDTAMRARIINDANTRRVSVCNALDRLLIHTDRLSDFPELCATLSESNVIVYADKPTMQSLNGVYPDSLLKTSTQESYGTEFLDYKMAVKTVSSVEKAVNHIFKYSSKHSECIVAEDRKASGYLSIAVDATCVYVNVPTSFTDEAQLGLGAEIGISTQKLHARGPMGLKEITTYKWLIDEECRIRK